MILRFREDERNDVHCKVSVFSALEGPTAGHSGVLTLDTRLWDHFRKWGLPRLVAPDLELRELPR